MSQDKFREVAEANIRYHTECATTYDRDQPHLKHENAMIVKGRIEAHARTTGGGRLLDLGTGTGFVLTLADGLFDEMYGVDITPAMLDVAAEKIRQGDIANAELIKAPSEELPFEDSHFDVITACGFLHHLPELEPTLKEVFRVLKKGGVFYASQDPNYYYRNSMETLSPDTDNISELMRAERNSLFNMADQVAVVTGKSLDGRTIEMAECLKTEGGFKEDDMRALMTSIGYKDISYEYTWFWMQGKVLKDLSQENAFYFENHLRTALPLTRNLFKYVNIEARK